MIQKSAWQAATNLIRPARRILIICHVSPDGDAIGSILGLGEALRSLDKAPTLACESEIPAKYAYLPGHQSIVQHLSTSTFELIIGLDCSDIRRLGSVYDAESMPATPLINIDHHTTNTLFGEVNLVDDTAVSTSQVILSLLDHLHVPLNRDIATCLLYGLVTDTIGFRTPNVTPEVMQVAFRLMEAGASLADITHSAFNQRPLADLKLLTCGLNRMQVDNGLIWSDIPLSVRAECGHQGTGDAGLSSILARTQGTYMSAVFCEMSDGRVEISFRAAPGFDVAQVALALGGGGHPTAAGCSVDGPLKAAREKVLAMLRTSLTEQKAHRNAPPAVP